MVQTRSAAKAGKAAKAAKAAHPAEPPPPPPAPARRPRQHKTKNQLILEAVRAAFHAYRSAGPDHVMSMQDSVSLRGLHWNTKMLVCTLVEGLREADEL